MTDPMTLLDDTLRTAGAYTLSLVPELDVDPAIIEHLRREAHEAYRLMAAYLREGSPRD